MAYRTREELVGKRFLSIKSDRKHKVGKISEWEWRPGFVRAVSTRDTSNADFTVLVEFDDTGWKSREYIKVHDVFLEFLIEHTLSWVERKDTTSAARTLWPALCFKPVVDKAGLFRHSKRPVEFLNDRRLAVVEEVDITYYREGDENNIPTATECPDVVKLVKAWTDYQDGQKILLTTPTVLLGYRVEVYRTEGTTQWYTAVIKSYNHANKNLTLTDDTVLEEHNEDPALIQMHLIGDGVVHSILNGVDVGVAQRRRPRSTVTKQNCKDSSSILNINRGTTGQQHSGSSSVTSPTKHCLGNSTSSVQQSPAFITTTSANGSRGGSAKSRAIVVVAASTSEDAHSVSVVDTPEAPGVKGQSQYKNQKQSSKRKSDPPAKAAKKPAVGKKIKTLVGEENLDTGSSVCKQTCNVVVKRIEEPTKTVECNDLPKPKASRLREKRTRNSRSPDLKGGTGVELSENNSCLLTSSKGHVDTSHTVSVCDSKDTLCSREAEKHKDNDKVKGKEDKEAANVFTKQSDNKQIPSPRGTIETPGDTGNHDKKAVCDISIKPSIATTPVVASTLHNVFINSISPPVSAKHQNKDNKPLSGQISNNDNACSSKQVNVRTKRVSNDLVNDKPVNSLPPGETTQEKDRSVNSPAIGSGSPGSESEEDMHYKKQILRAGGNTSPPQNTHAPAEDIDVSLSVTDQLSKRKVSDKYSLNGDGKFRPDVVDITENISSSSSSLSSHHAAELDRSECNPLGKPRDFSGDRQSAFTCVQSSVSRSNSVTPGTLDRADSRASDGQLNLHLSDDKLYGSRFDDIRSVRSSPGTSPLVSDRHETANPYRDPELMRKLFLQSNVQNILAAQHKMNQSGFPSVHTPIPVASASSSQSSAAFAGAPTLPARSLLSALPYPNTHHLPSSLSHHLTLPHGYPMDAVVRAQQIAVLQQQHLMGYSLGSAPAMAALEALWQRKFPATPLPAPYMIQKNQDSLLSSDAIASALHREHIQLQIDHERREIERIEVERRERERLEQELREKERKEIIERERQEKEAERNKIERERKERERLEKDRVERERQEWEHKHSQDRILDTEAAVDQHFAESLTRLASQQGITMFPSITRGTGRGMVPKTEPHHALPTHGLSYHEKKHFEHRTDDPVKREVEAHTDDKRYINVSECDKSSVFSGFPCGYHPGTGLPQPGQKPFFNLYGYPSSHSTITPEQLKQRGLTPEMRQVKEEVIDKKHSYSPVAPHAASPVHLNQAYTSKEIQRDSHNSVIVKPQLKIENPVAAHSHHSSPSSSSPRPQQPRPAHTPEHHRPERPLSSSTSPASIIHPHHLHHSSPIPPGSNHPPPLPHNSTYCSTEVHTAPRSQSPYKPAASQLQSQPLNFCKTSVSDRLKVLEQQQQQHPSPTVNSGYPSSMAQAPVSVPSSVAYSYSLIQQGLVPNPIYSHMGPSHPSGPPPQHSNVPHTVGGPAPTSAQDPKPVQISPPGSKRKTGSKDSNSFNRKKPKGHSELSGAHQPMSIPETTPQVMTNPSPYTTSSSSSSSTITKSGISSATSSSSPSLTSLTHSHINTGFLDSFKSFVENTVQNAFLQDEKKAHEKAERERSMATNQGPSTGSKAESDSHDRKSEGHIQPGLSGSHLTSLSATNQDVPQPSALDSYSSRITDTINRVANNQTDTDSDTVRACSPPPQIKPSDTNSPLNKGSNSSCSSHPHHMKKAWLQRHDEDKKSETPVPSQGDEDSNSSHTRDIICCVENPSAPLADCGTESGRSSPADVVVTLPNGNINDLNHHSDESTSSASESEMQSSSKTPGPHKRLQSDKLGSGSSKKVKSDGNKQATSPIPPSSTSSNSSNNSNSKKKFSSKRGKTERENQSKDDSQTVTKEEALYISSKQSNNNNPQPSKGQEKNNKVSCLATTVSSSPHSERSNPSPALSESSMSQASSTSSTSSTVSTNSKSSNFMNKKKSTSQNKDSKKSSSFNKPLVKMTVSILKRTMMPFIQDGPCSEITPKLNKCRECKMTPVQLSKKQPNIFCRFYAFRRLKYNSRGIVTIHGFSELSDADPDDIEPWLPRYPVEEPELDVENSKFIIARVGDKFCELVEQEKEAKSWAGDNVNIVWKRAVVGVREMCDVCDTTLFNMHWVCHKCGFVVCLDCYEVRMKDGKKTLTDDKWLTCSSSRQAHKASEMMLTQIIPSDALWELGRLIHDIRIKWSIPSNCPCGGNNVENKVISKNGINQFLNAANTRKFPNGYGVDEHGSKHLKSKKQPDSNSLKNLDAYHPDTTSSPLSILAEVASMEPDSSRDKADVKRKADKSSAPDDELLEESEKKSSCSTLRELLTKTAGKPKGTNDKRAKKGSGLSTLDNIIQSVVEKSCTDGGAPFKFLHYTPRLGGWKRELPIMVHNLTETSVLYPDVPHSWLCDGRLLRLHDAHHKGNLQIFQEQWRRGQPVLVSCANKKMNINIWKPEVFSKEFGHIDNEVVNCRTGDVIIGHTMGDFWDGFENLGNRPTDSSDEPMLLKLKDWPPGDDFSELLPSRFQDLMNALPLPEYTQRNGKLNLASRLPDFLVRPDLGPKMYNAYGSSHFPREGTTNLHLDISDAVNVMVYVGVPGDGPGGRKAQEEAAVKAIDDAGCDSITKRRVREVHEIPGALWHIYDAHDADKIRDFLNKVAKERGESIEKDHDAIHDQSWYLDKELCDRLLKEYGVQGYTIVQCLGDAIFIPAGAPHQVRNLHSCIKVAEDFVSPEHLNHCFRLTQEFRQLSETHSNHEDKLQVKNIIYHAVKDAVAVLRENDPDDE